MTKKANPPPTGARHNPVAKFAPKVNRAVCFRDRTLYRRKAKHKAREPFPVCVRSVERRAVKARGC